MKHPVISIALAASFLTSMALGEESESGIDKAQHEIEGATKELGKKAGVRPEVLNGSRYGAAGCGLGSLIFEPDNGFLQVFAATTNGSFGTQTFGITSGTSNCGSEPEAANAVHSFVIANRARLSIDVARGGGETIKSLSALAQCRDASVLGSTLQRHFTGIFPSAQVSDVEVGERLLRVMHRETRLGCHALG